MKRTREKKLRTVIGGGVAHGSKPLVAVASIVAATLICLVAALIVNSPIASAAQGYFATSEDSSPVGGIYNGFGLLSSTFNGKNYTAYCLEQNQLPPAGGTFTYVDLKTGNRPEGPKNKQLGKYYNYVLYHGYHGQSMPVNICGYTFTDKREAQMATQIATWMVQWNREEWVTHPVSGLYYQTGTNPNDFSYVTNSRGKKNKWTDYVTPTTITSAAKALYDAAMSGTNADDCPSYGVVVLTSVADQDFAIPYQLGGGVKLQKSDVYTGNKTPQGDATFKGAEFKISNETNSVTITTNADGYAETSSTALQEGTYTVTETTAPAGYSKVEPFTVKVTTGTMTTATNGGTGSTVAETPIMGGIRVRKVDADTLSLDYFNNGEAQGDATLDGTELHLYNRSANAVRVGGKDYAKDARITTIPLEDGTTSDVLTIKNGTAATAADALPYGTYEVIEAEPGKGYLLSDDKQTFQVRENGVVVDPGATNDDAKIENKVITGSVAIAKFTQDFTDDASEKDKTNNPQGDATFKGAEFTLKNVSEQAIQIDGKVYDVGAELVDNILVVGDDGYARSGKVLPYGTYEMRETKAPAGYKLDDTVWRFSIRRDGQTITFDKISGPTEVDGDTDASGAGANRGAIEDNYHGGIRVIKVDKDLFALRDNADELDDYEYTDTQGDASTLDGTEFGIWNRSAHKVDVGGRIYEPGERIMTIPLADETTSDVLVIKNGTAETANDALPYGTYEVSETKSVPEYEDTAQSWDNITIREADEGKLKEPSDDDIIKDSVVRGGITMPKIDHDLAGIDGEAEKENNPQGDATMEGAEFGVRNMSENAIVVGGHVYQTSERITTIPQPDGSIKDVIVADANGLASTSANALPVGTYQVWETKPPEGYELNTTDTWTVTIDLTETNTDVNKNVKPSGVEDRIPDDVYCGGLSVQKVDKETGTGDTLTAGAVKSDGDSDDSEASDDENADDGEVEPQASDDASDNATDEASDADASNDDSSSDGEYTEPEFSPGSDLSGTQFAIVNRSKSHVYVDGTLYQVGEVVKTITTDGKGYAATEADELPYGTYDVYEVAAPVRYISSADSYGNSNAIDEDGEFVLDDEGNRLTPKFVQTVVIREPNVIVPCTRPFANQVKRGDIAFEKIDDDGNIMPNVAFKVTSKTTGESHIVMTDENGVFNSSSNHMRHSKDTNANDGAFNSDGNIDDSALNGDSGVWFYGNADGKPGCRRCHLPG